MSVLKQLAGQTIWYGVSNIAARLLTYLLTPYLTYKLTGPVGQELYGEYSYIYILFPVMNVLYTYGMETSFFRYSREENFSGKLYNTQMSMMLITTLLLSAALILFQQPVSEFAEIPQKSYYITWCAAILALDALATLPYARLRNENRPRKYALTKVLGIVIFVLVIVLLFSFESELKSIFGNSFTVWYDKHRGLGFILFANLLQCVITLILLIKEWKNVRLSINKEVVKKVLLYGLPILIAGFGGVFNDSLNRVMYMKLFPASPVELKQQLGIFSATVRLSIMITLAIQAFKLAAEPFFFSISKQSNAKDNYARVMLWFFICLSLMFLHIVLFIDLWQYFLGSQYREALYLTPVLLIANIFLGIYYNLSIWYKLTDKTRYGAYIMLTGAVVTFVFNYFTIPQLGYAACAYSMLISYGFMMTMSYFLGQKHYPIRYPIKKIGQYFLVMLLIFGIQRVVMIGVENVPLRITSGVILFTAYLYYIWRKEGLALAHMIRRKS